MKKKWFEVKSSVLKRIGCLALVAALAGTGVVTYQNSGVNEVEELPVFVDSDSIVVQEDATPLALGTKTTRKVTTKTTTKKTKMKKKAKKTATTTKKSTKQKNSTKKTSAQQIKTNTKIATTIKTKTKKNSNVKTTQTKVVTTVTTTTTTLKTAAPAKAKKTTASSSNVAAGNYNIKSVAPKADARVLSAFENIGGKVVVNPGVAYSGCFDAGKRTITMKTLDSTIYHELGHFVEFVGGTPDVKAKITAAYNSEKNLYTAYNYKYVLQNSSEYFAESFKNYCENAAALKKARPATYDAITEALNNITDTRVNLLKNVYASVWK